MYLFDEGEQVTPGAELQDEPHIIPRLVPVVKLEHVGTAEAVNDLKTRLNEYAWRTEASKEKEAGYVRLSFVWARVEKFVGSCAF